MKNVCKLYANIKYDLFVSYISSFISFAKRSVFASYLKINPYFITKMLELTKLWIINDVKQLLYILNHQIRD